MHRSFRVASFFLIGLLPLNVSVRAAEIQVTPQQLEKLEIRLTKISPADTETIAVLPGTVIPALNARHVVTTPFSGTVTSVAVMPGQSVQKGQALATLASRDLLEATSHKRQAEADLHTTEAEATRLRQLADKNIISPMRAVEAEAKVEKVSAVLEEHKRMLGLGGIEGNPDGTFTLPSPAAGRVVEVNALPGSSLMTMGSVVVLDTSNELWVEAQIPAQLMAKVHIGDAVQVANGPSRKNHLDRRIAR